jgi:cardiolipin synthase A/B
MTMLYAYLLDHWLTIHGLTVILGLAAYVTTSHTLHLRRNPSAAIGWVVSLALFPYMALPLYLIFGIRKVQSHRAVAAKPGFAAQPSNPGFLAYRTQQLAATMSLPAASPYRQLTLHKDGSQALQAMHDMIDAATRSIDLCTFIFARDPLGEDISAGLQRRAKDGIRVRLLVDGVGAYLRGHADFRSLSAAGVEVVLFVPPLRSPLRGRTNLRNHRKMLVTDGEWLWCGGRNLAAEYFEGDATSPPWLDLSFDLHGALALQAQQQFEHDWAFATRRAPPGPTPAIGGSFPAGAAMGQLIASGPDQADDTLNTLLVSGFLLSNKRILAVTPYFVPNPTLLMSLTLAARRGVAVDLLLPRKSNHRMADLARHRALRELTAAGGRVWFLPQMIHAKAVVIDDELALAGSANLDERSLFLNYELMVAFYEPSAVQRIAEAIERQLGNAMAYRAQPAGLWREIAEGMLLWLAFQL